MQGRGVGHINLAHEKKFRREKQFSVGRVRGLAKAVTAGSDEMGHDGVGRDGVGLKDEVMGQNGWDF